MLKEVKYFKDNFNNFRLIRIKRGGVSIIDDPTEESINSLVCGVEIKNSSLNALEKEAYKFIKGFYNV